MPIRKMLAFTSSKASQSSLLNAFYGPIIGLSISKCFVGWDVVFFHRSIAVSLSRCDTTSCRSRALQNPPLSLVPTPSGAALQTVRWYRAPPLSGRPWTLSRRSSGLPSKWIRQQLAAQARAFERSFCGSRHLKVAQLGCGFCRIACGGS